MPTYRVIAKDQTLGGPITAVVVRKDTGARLKKRHKWSVDSVLKLMKAGVEFYVFDPKQLRVGRLRPDGRHISTVGDDDFLDNLEAI